MIVEKHVLVVITVVKVIVINSRVVVAPVIVRVVVIKWQQR